MTRKSFSLIEVLLAVAIFSLVASFFIFLIIESYKINERAKDLSLATVLAEEGMEAVRSIRDVDFSKLVSHSRSYCLAIEDNHWVLKQKKNRNTVIDCIEPIGKFSRQLYISTVNATSRKITVVVSWQPISGASREVRFFSWLTNWR